MMGAWGGVGLGVTVPPPCFCIHMKVFILKSYKRMPLLNLYLRKMKTCVHPNIFTQMFTTASLTIAQKQKQGKCP